MVKSNQRITKIKRDPIEELLKRAEATPIEDAVIVNEPGSDLIPYPDFENFRLWIRDNLLKGINCIYNNYIDNNGETYYTTIVDGLILMTKNTKAIGQHPIIEQPYSWPAPTSNGSIGGNEIGYQFNPSASEMSGHEAYNCMTSSEWAQFNFTVAKLPEYETTGYVGELIVYNPTPIKPTSFWFSWGTRNGGKQDPNCMSKYAQCLASNDGQVWQVLWELDMTPYVDKPHLDIEAAIKSQLNTNQFFKYFKLKFKDHIGTLGNHITINWFKPMGVCLAPGDVTSSKPGLQLSNLISPFILTSAGGWLRQNLVSNSHNEFNQLNTDTIGNYSYSFLNNGIIYRQSGSTHSGQDSYIQHWSPSLLGSMSYEGMIIPKGLNQTFLFKSSYTNYQTLAVPNNPDMQRYATTDSKEVTYQFVDNNNNNPPTITTFNGRFVGKDWSYELEFKQNNSGSCMGYDPETGDCPSHENQSNGGCVTGKIIYTAGQGTPCEVQIDECFNTYQSIANPDYPTTPDLKYNTLETPNMNKYWKYDYCNGLGANSYCLCSNQVSTLYCCSGGFIEGQQYSWGEAINNPTGSQTGNIVISNGLGAGVQVVNSKLSDLPDLNCNINLTTCTQLIPFVDSQGCGSFYVPDSSALEPVNGIDIYFNIKDIKEEYIINDVPWDYDCTVTRFETWFSTEPSSDIGVNSILIASNVNINSLGDISMLTDKTL